MRTIYAPTGRALEYSPLAFNIYSGCAHKCTYCFARKMAKMYGTPEYDFNIPKPRNENILVELDKKCAALNKTAGGSERREINLCFMCDPYSTPTGHDITRDALLILEKHRMNVSILTKAGTKACRDFDILERNHWKLGVTMTCFGKTRKEKEPGAATAINRMHAIDEAKKMGIFTWISIEPVFDTDQALEIMKWNRVDMLKIGKINYCPELERGIDWKKFVADARAIIGDRPHMFKKDLLTAAGEQ
jgi:DNA repair photolyase